MMTNMISGMSMQGGYPQVGATSGQTGGINPVQQMMEMLMSMMSGQQQQQGCQCGGCQGGCQGASGGAQMRSAGLGF